jgi:hypothetical protein
MKSLLTVILIIYCQVLLGQVVKGKVVDAESKDAIKYVNIGVVGKSKGTVSGADGLFLLELLPEYDRDTLRMSVVGYHPVTFVVQDIKHVASQTNFELVIELSRKIPILQEVIIAPLAFEKKTIGNKSWLKGSSIVYESNKDISLGSEVGTVMTIKKRSAYIKDVNFIVTSNSYKDSILFRINLYEMKDGLPGENLLKEPILVSTKIKKGTLTVNLEESNIYVENDFFLSLEWLKEMGENSIGFSVKIGDRKSFHRSASQASWEQVPACGLNFYTTVLYIR